MSPSRSPADLEGRLERGVAPEPDGVPRLDGVPLVFSTRDMRRGVFLAAAALFVALRAVGLRRRVGRQISGPVCWTPSRPKGLCFKTRTRNVFESRSAWSLVCGFTSNKI